jgi:lipid-A-disaccharide synthase
MGLAEGIGAIPAHIRALKRLRKRFATRHYDLVILVDYPGFHLRVAAAANRYGVPVLYYIAPQLWAWGAWRVRSVRKHVNRIAAVLPFEAEYFASRGLAAEFVGHPLLDRENVPSRTAARASLGISGQATVLGLLPGSRSAEIERIWPHFRDAAKILNETDPSIRIVVGAIEGIEYPGAPEYQYCVADAPSVIAAADAILCKSGTAALEAAIAGTPTVIAYRMHPVTFRVARWVVQVPHVGLVNLIAEREVCPEFLQGDASPQNLANAVAPLLETDGEAASIQREAFAEVRTRLGGPGATLRVAQLVERMVT